MCRKDSVNRGPRISQKLLIDVYERLYDRFGPQGWWPGDTTLEVCLGAILVQNTSWTNAARAIGNLKKEDLLTEGALKSAICAALRLAKPRRSRPCPLRNASRPYKNEESTPRGGQRRRCAGKTL